MNLEKQNLAFQQHLHDVWVSLMVSHSKTLPEHFSQIKQTKTSTMLILSKKQQPKKKKK